MRPYLLLVVFLVVSGIARAQLVFGIVSDTDGNPLPFATVYFPDLKKGTAANADGVYEIELTRGTHVMRFQYLGYRTHEERVTISGKDIELNVQLAVEPVQLTDVTVLAEREDPAYTIIRKAIAKAKYHTQQLDGYTATAYIKGSGRLRGVPALFRKKIESELEKEGIDTSTAFTSESVSEIRYTRPNQYEETVISIRTVGDDMNTDPVGFIQSSFYEPEVNGSVSPLSPRAFAYYRYEYLGEFSDQGYTINKIRVIPRSRGDNVFDGTIYIVDQHWSIHSLDLDTYIWGIKFNIQQIYQPVKENVWLPLNQIFHVTGAFFGFKFEFQYFANISDYDIQLNPDLDFVPELIDDKLRPEEARHADAKLGDTQDAVLSQLASGDEVSRKQLKKLLKAYEKEEQRAWESGADTLQGVSYVYAHSVDSMAYKRDSVYWTRIRPIPLTEFEEKGYWIQDSLAIVRAEEARKEQDTLEVTIGSQSDVLVRSKSAFEIKDILTGGSYRISEKVRFALDPLIGRIGFNTVDGYHAEWGVRWYASSGAVFDWSIAPQIRYAFARDLFSYRLLTRWGAGKPHRKWAIVAEGGRFPFQINPANPIHPLINGFMTTTFERNYMKLLEKEYVLLGWQKNFDQKYNLGISAEWAKNIELRNHSDWTLFDRKKRTYTPNAPLHAKLGEVHFPVHHATQFQAELTARPWLKYSIRNGRKSVIQNSSPTLTLAYETAIPDLFDSDVEFHRVEGGLRHTLTFPAGGILNFHVTAGMHFGKDQMYFPQWKHFAGNRTPFATLDPAKSYRMLDYYLFSTNEEYMMLFTNYQFRKLLATQIFEVRLAGIRESVFLNLLENPVSEHYFELGYGLNYILRIFRLEFVTAWQDFRYRDFAVRIGIAANLDNVFR